MGRRPKITIGNSCPNCGAVWGLDEMEQETCFACGYPDVNQDNFPDDGLEDYERDFCAECGCEPCDCRNKRG